MVDICLPNSLHCETALKALESGKDVFIEMPLANNIEDGNKIIETAKKCNRRVFVDLFSRHKFAYKYLSSIVNEGKLGKCKMINVERLTPPWWGNLDTEAIGRNLMHHDIDFVLQLFGEPLGISVSSIDVRKDQAIVTTNFEYEDCYAIINASSAMPGASPFSVGYEAVFENGSVRYFEDSYMDGKLETKLELFTQEEHKEVKLQDCDCYLESIFKVDYDILALCGFYIVVMALYVFFEVCVVNYRPVLIEGCLEASYPSSTTLLVMCVMPTTIMQLNKRIKNNLFKNIVCSLIVVFAVFMVVGRLISGVHWLTDIIGGAILSVGLVSMYNAVCKYIKTSRIIY